jgi:flagellar hook-associated protein 1 FlgK
MSELANRGEQYNTISSNQASMVESINAKRTEVTGVSSDEELTNLIKYQHAYNASARMITTLDEIINTTVNRLGLVGR